MLDLSYSLGVSPLLHFMLPEALLNSGILVRGCVGVENPNVCKGPLKSPTTKRAMSSLAPLVVMAERPDITSVVTSCRSCRLNANIIAYFAQESSCDIPDLIVRNRSPIQSLALMRLAIIRKVCRMLYTELFYAIIPACFLSFCCSAIPTSPYIFNVFLHLFTSFFSLRTILSSKFKVALRMRTYEASHMKP